MTTDKGFTSQPRVYDESLFDKRRAQMSSNNSPPGHILIKIKKERKSEWTNTLIFSH